MFTYCLNNPVMLVDPDGRCSRFLGFLWKIDCGKATCEDSVNYNPSATRVAVIYDGRYSGLLRTDILAKGFRDQGQVVINDLETIHAVESFAYSDMDGFVNAWNSLGGEYDKIYILGHGYPGGMSCDGKSISNSGNEAYSFWDLNPVPARTVYLYTCHGASFDGQGNSVAAAFSVITGGTVYGVIDGKLSYDYWTLTPYPTKGGRWSVTPPLS